MDFNINNNISENQINRNEIFKSEIKYSDTNDSSKNIEIEILPRIENIVSTANLCCNLNLREIAMQAKNAEYNPKRFSAVIMKIKEPKTTALIFSSGRIVTLGAKTEEDSRKSCRKFAKIIKSLNYQVFFKEFKIQNIVGSVDIKFQISLMKLYMHLIKNSYWRGKNYVAYEPEQFPGLIYRMIEPNIVLLIFVSGKIVLTGGKIREDIYQGFKKIYPLLVKFKIDDTMKNNKMLHQDNVRKMKELEKEKI
jgi:transcription initiation factor TFIID TATA-box-binding protein